MNHRPTTNRTTACRDFHRTLPLTRRAALRIGGMGLLGLTMPKLLRAEQARGQGGVIHPPARAKSVIFLFQFGGPSHIDMFDMKPDAPEGVRGPYTSIPTSVPGIGVCERLPRVAQIMDRCTQIRSMTHTMNNHNSAAYYALAGHAPPSDDQRLRDTVDLCPAYGSVVDRVAPRHGAIPTFVSFPHRIADGSITPGQHASFLGKKHDPLYIGRDPNADDFALPELSLPEGLSIDRLHDRRGLLEVIDGQSRLLDAAAEAAGIDQYYDKALTMLSSDHVRRAFDLASEPAEIRDAYGRTTYGQSCLLARRLVESGVKFVTVYFSDSIGGQSTEKGGWDTHGFNDTRMFPIIEKYHLPITEHTLPTLIYDLERRGMLEETLVVWIGEFGRTPNINKNVSRDHWPQCYTALLFGGGVKGGYVYGSSDRNGAFPASDPVTPDDLAATMYHLLGIDPTTEIHDAQNRPLPISYGSPVTDIVA